jgi:hypothetical protein
VPVERAYAELPTDPYAHDCLLSLVVIVWLNDRDDPGAGNAAVKDW